MARNPPQSSQEWSVGPSTSATPPGLPTGAASFAAAAPATAAGASLPAQADEKISPAQMGALIAHLTISTLAIFAPSAIIRAAQQDSWLSVLIGMAVAFAGTMGLGYTVARIAPGQGLLEALDRSWPWPIRILALVLGVSLLHLEALVGVQIGALWNYAQMPETPVAFFVSSALVLAALMARAGIEPLGRTGLLIAGILTFAPALLVLLALNLLHLVELKPVLASGWQPVLAGAQPVFGFAGEAVLLLLLFGHLYIPPGRSPGRTAVTVVSQGMALASAVTFVFLIVDIAALGPRDAGRILFPTMSVVRMIRLGEFLQRLEGAALLLWSWGIIVKLAILQLAACQAWGTVFGVRDPRILSFPIAGLAIGVYRLLFGDVVQLTHYLSVWGLIWLAIGVLPIALGVLLVWLRPPATARSPAPTPSGGDAAP